MVSVGHQMRLELFLGFSKRDEKLRVKGFSHPFE